MAFKNCFLFISLALITTLDVDGEPSNRIVGGEPARLGELPYQVSLRRNNRHFCGGTIIGQQSILTAAHCVGGYMVAPYNDITVVTGTESLLYGGQAHRISRATVHPQYVGGSQSSWRNDVAVLTLTAPITFNAYQSSINLASSDISAGAQGIVSGWGYLSANNQVPSNNLKKLTTTVYSAPSCQQQMSIALFSDQLCTVQATGRGICLGDSGGPLVVNGEVAGIASFVIPCARGRPDIFTKVYSFKDFILGQMNY